MHDTLTKSNARPRARVEEDTTAERERGDEAEVGGEIALHIEEIKEFERLRKCTRYEATYLRLRERGKSDKKRE